MGGVPPSEKGNNKADALVLEAPEGAATPLLPLPHAGGWFIKQMCLQDYGLIEITN